VIMKIFTVRDNVVQAYLQPFFSVNEGSAIRSLQEVVNDPNHTFAKYPADYSLYFVGSFDDATGVITPEPEPHRLVSLIDLVKTT